jgi:hypothetical protein
MTPAERTFYTVTAACWAVVRVALILAAGALALYVVWLMVRTFVA